MEAPQILGLTLGTDRSAVLTAEPKSSDARNVYITLNWVLIDTLE
jgi:hypothetical protein